MSSPAPIAEPQQRRSRRTLQRILDAFEQALDAQTFEEITVGSLCEQAGCSVGTFYGRVESKDVLLEHLRQRLFEEVRTRAAPLFGVEHARSTTLPALIREQMRALIELHAERRGVIRAVIVQARRQTAFAGPTRDFNTAMLRLVAQSWLVHREAIVHADPIAAVEQAALMAGSYLREAIVFGELWPTQRTIDETARLELLHRMLVGFLMEPLPAHAQPSFGDTSS